MLGDAAGLSRNHIGLADGIEQRGLAVVDVAHDGDHGGARLEVAGDVGDAHQALLDIGLRDAAHLVAELLGDELRGVGVDDIVDLVHLPLLHQELDDVDGALGHSVGELLDGDRLRNDDVAGDLLLAGLVA